MRSTLLKSIAGLLFVILLSLSARADEVALVVDSPLATPAKEALDELQKSLTNHEYSPRLTTKLEGMSYRFIVGVAGVSSQVDRALADAKIELPTAPESLTVQWVAKDPHTLLIAGRDPRGLTYALREVSHAIYSHKLSTSAVDDKHSFSYVTPATESPFLKHRSVTVHLFNTDVEKEWYFSESFWRHYFKRLSLYRFNQLTLTFSDQTNYLCPAYAFLVDMPEYPGVQVKELTTEDRKRNLDMLRRITELAATYGVEFSFGIWMQAPIPKYAAEVRVSGLPEGRAMADYCARGIRRVLEACPAIRGVQFRMNAEAGVAEDQQTAFYKPLFQAIRAVGRPIRLDLRYKGLQESTTQAAIDEKLDVTVSTKFWAEHFGLPYHPTVVDSHYRESRYSFGNMLKKPRDYRVVYRLWNVGSNRLTVWGDPDYAARFAEACKLGGGEGLEVFAPLTNKGYGDKPGTWPVIKDIALRGGRWEQDRYWYFYLCFGRMGYNPRTTPEIWQREFRSRFGPFDGNAWREYELVYRSASQVLPFITATRLPGASEWSWWPEMDTGGKLTEYATTQPSDTSQFYAVRRWQSSPDWRWEPWDAVPGYVEDVMQGQLRAKWTPPMISQRLRQLADQIDHHLHNASPHLLNFNASGPLNVDDMTAADFPLLALLARYHASKLDAATHFAFFEAANQPARLNLTLTNLQDSVQTWKQIVKLTNPVYHDNLIFGVTPENVRNKFGHHHSGNWQDRLPEIEAEIKSVNDLIEKHREQMKPFEPFALENAVKHTYQIEHTPPKELSAFKEFEVRINVASTVAPRRVIVHHRSLDQTRDWTETTMMSDGAGVFRATISSKQIESRFDFQYYFEVLDDGVGARWPSWENGPPYIVVTTTK